jgi:hypothetical protein
MRYDEPVRAYVKVQAAVPPPLNPKSEQEKLPVPEPDVRDSPPELLVFPLQTPVPSTAWVPATPAYSKSIPVIDCVVTLGVVSIGGEIVPLWASTIARGVVAGDVTGTRKTRAATRSEEAAADQGVRRRPLGMHT